MSSLDHELHRLVQDIWEAAYHNDVFGYPVSVEQMMALLRVLGFRQDRAVRKIVTSAIMPLIALGEARTTIAFARMKQGSATR